MGGSTWLTWMMPKSPSGVAVEVHPDQKPLMVNTNIDREKSKTDKDAMV